MLLEYAIVYKTENTYEDWVNGAHWQFLIIPEENDTQEYVSVTFENSLQEGHEFSSNGFNFKTIRLRPNQKFKDISFEANFKLIKKKKELPATSLSITQEQQEVMGIDFKALHEPFLRKTKFTTLPEQHMPLFSFSKEVSLLQNLKNLNEFVFLFLYFKTGVTTVSTTLKEVMAEKHGVCQDFTHLFCAIARKNNIPTRYVSGYLHQGSGFFGDAQMHAWAECFIPQMGWVAFDPTNNLLPDMDHIKVSHGKDYTDCAPLKGVVYTSGANTTSYMVQVSSQQ